MSLLRRGHFVSFSCLVLLSVLGRSAEAGFISFEALPGGSPAEGVAINTQYEAMTGMRFHMQDGSHPLLAELGGAHAAFNYYGGGTLDPQGEADIPAPGQDVGSFFLTAPTALTTAVPSPLIVSINSAVASIQGDILDIDTRNEAWKIEAFQSDGTLLGSIFLDTSSPGAGDGLATRWAFNFTTNIVSSVVLTYVGGLDHGLGFAWDNFRTERVTETQRGPVIPEPSTIFLGALGALCLWRHRRGWAA